MLRTPEKATTISKALSPDQSIAHGATYYAGIAC